MKLLKSKFFPFIALFLLTIPAFWFLLRPGIYWNMHDDMQLVRQMEMEKCLKDGQIPCRWTPDLGYGYGYPLFNFYPPAPYFVGQIFRFTSLPFIETIKLTAVTQFIVSALGMYLLASSLFGIYGGILSSIFYTYAPYHAVNIYVRGAMNEAWASAFFPFILYFSKKYIEKRQLSSLIYLSLSFALLMLSHNPMVLIFSPFVLIWSLFWIYQQKIKLRLPSIISLGASSILAFCLSAFFTLPVLFETKYVQVESMFINYYHYSIHFVSLKQLFINNFWGDGPSVWGTGDGMSFSIGYLHWIIPLLISLYIALKYIRRQKVTVLDVATLLITFSALFTTFLTHERSTFIWQILSPIQKIQFPWRFLNVAAFLFSLSVGYVGYFIKDYKNKTKIFLVSVITVLLFLLNISHFTPVTSGPITDAQKFSGIAWTNQITGGIYDYLPKTASTAPKSPAKDYIDEVIPTNSKYELTGQKKGTDWTFFNIKNDTPITIYLPILDFPYFQVNLDGKNIKHQTEPLLGRVSISLESGQHQIYVKLTNTPIRTVGNLLTTVALITVLLSLIYIWKKSK